MSSVSVYDTEDKIIIRQENIDHDLKTIAFSFRQGASSILNCPLLSFFVFLRIFFGGVGGMCACIYGLINSIYNLNSCFI